MAYTKTSKHGTMGRLETTTTYSKDSFINVKYSQLSKDFTLYKEVITLKSTYTVTLSSIDLFQTIDALSSRAEAYEQTARYLMGNYEKNEFIIIEECRDHSEAQAIANHFREIIKKIEYQISSCHK